MPRLSKKSLDALPTDRKIKKIMSEMISSQPFYGEILYTLDAIESTYNDTAYTDCKNIYYNKEFFDGLSYAECLFVELHELWHCIALHPFRVGNKNQYVHNIACDLVINYRLVTKISDDLVPYQIEIEPPKCAVLARTPEMEGKTELDLYRLILPQYEQQSEKIEKQIKELIDRMNGVSSGTSDSGEKISTGITLDIYGEKVVVSPEQILMDIMKPKGNPTDVRNAEQKMKRAIVRARVTAKRAGNMPLGVDRLVDGILGTTIPWHYYVRKYLQAMLEDDTDFASPDKNFLYRDIILPGQYDEDKALEDLLVVDDMSGSIGDEEYKEFMYQLKCILKEFYVTGRLLSFDTEVQSDIEISSDTNVETVKLRGGGGTEFNCVPKYLKDKKIRYSCMIVLTDGYLFSLPPYMHDVVWVITKTGDFSFNPPSGKVIQLSKF